MKKTANILKKTAYSWLIAGVVMAMTDLAQARIVFQSEFLLENTGGNAWVIDSEDDATGDLQLQFGSFLAETITFDSGNDWFELSNDLSLNNNQLIEAEIENVSALPGGGGGLGAAGEGRIVILDTLDNTAPGCTIDPFCAAGPYIWNGSIWLALASTDSSSTKYVHLDIFGSVTESVKFGGMAGEQVGVIIFDPDGVSYMRYAVPVPDDWESGTDIVARIYWSPTDNSNGDVDFNFDFASFAVGEQMLSTSFTDLIPAASYETVAINTQDDLYSFTVDLPNASLAADDIITFRLGRNGSNAGDTYISDIYILLVRLEYTAS